MPAVTKLHVERHGDGPDLVLLHGWGLHSGAWTEALPALARRFRVHAIDLPGHGHSARVPVPGFDDCADEVARLVPAGAALCGWSLGGLIALRIAMLHPARARALVLVAATPCFVQRADWPHAMQPATLDEFAHGLRGDRDATLASFVRLNALHGAQGRDAIRAFMQRLGERAAPSATALGESLQWLRETDLRAATASIAIPALVIHGTRDALAPVAAGRWLAATLPGASLREIPGAAHLPFFTHRDLFVNALESFLA
jgi:pimeloyl-[acyl-carrier protein] methyl ester esterase